MAQVARGQIKEMAQDKLGIMLMSDEMQAEEVQKGNECRNAGDFSLDDHLGEEINQSTAQKLRIPDDDALGWRKLNGEFFIDLELDMDNNMDDENGGKREVKVKFDRHAN